MQGNRARVVIGLRIECPAKRGRRFDHAPASSGYFLRIKLKLKGKIVWITGASSGIGEALAIEGSLKGARLVLSARRRERLDEVLAACASPENHLVLPLDLTAPETFETAHEEIRKHVGEVDILINNGGVAQRGRVVNTRSEVNRHIMEVNFFGAVGLTKAVLPSMIERGSGHIVVISSLVGKFSTPGRSIYAASKHALQGFFEALRAEAWDQGIRVTIVCPGFIHTEISRNALRSDGSRHNRMDNSQEKGMAADVCARAIVRAIEKDKRELIVGGIETAAVYIKRFLPGLFDRIIRKTRI